MIAATILQQIGGRRFVAMTGSRDFMDLGDGVRMNLSRNKTSANRLAITLDKETDTYRMRFYRMTVSKHFEVKTKDIAVYEGVYCDRWDDIFTTVTVLYTILKTLTSSNYENDSSQLRNIDRPLRGAYPHVGGKHFRRPRSLGCRLAQRVDRQL